MLVKENSDRVLVTYLMLIFFKVYIIEGIHRENMRAYVGSETLVIFLRKSVKVVRP